MVQCTFRPLVDLQRRDLEAWAELAGDAAEPNPFYEPDFVLPAVAALGDADLALMSVWDAGSLIACLPVATGRWRGVLPATAGWRHMYAFLGTPLVRKGQVESAISGLLTGRGRRFLVLERASLDGPVGRAIGAATAAHNLRLLLEVPFERALLRRREDGEYLAGIRSHHRRDLERLGRRLAERLGGELTTVDRAGEEAATRSFLGLEARGWKGRGGTAMASHTGHAEFFAEICRRFAAAGRLQLLELAGNGRPVAMKCNLKAGEGWFAFKIAHDEEFDGYSPGVQLELSNIARFHASGAAWMDSCADADNLMINRLWPERRRLCSLVLSDRSGVAKAAGAGLQVANRVRRRRRVG